MGLFQIIVTISVGGDIDRGQAVVCVSTNHYCCNNLKCILKNGYALIFKRSFLLDF